MQRISSYLKCAVAAVAASMVFLTPVLASEDSELDALLEGLKTADIAGAAQIQNRIYEIWSNSGSDAMDLLLARGREAMAEGDTRTAIEHFTALIDHAPDFAEGYNARATAYFQQGRYGLSLEDIRQTLARNPSHFGALSGLALILEEIGKPEAALAAWREVEKLNPTQEGLAEALVRLERQVEGSSL
ncbi:MAG: tetratricopeptide repeat protein [Boseongicola sp.]|nr:tetratricopeptide repeat protein [Boseongicola sp.]MDD9979452.1 tetratricopeptide repeat protein [Boseongicola sp.]